MNIRINTDKTGIAKSDIEALRPETGKALDRLWSGNEPMTGWVQLPTGACHEGLEYILNLADAVKNEAELFVVLGIGGSYLGAKAAIEALPKYERGIPVKFLGNNLCTDYFWETIEEIKKKKTILCVISKSGNTMEVRTAFEIVKPLLVDRYGSEEEAAKRIIAITDAEKGSLREEANEKGYTSMSIPADIGGRYSVLTPAGLLPMAVSGIDVRALLSGAAEMAGSPEWDTDLTDYAICRYLLQQRGKEVEFIELCHSRLAYLGEWIKQLYGESEGKEGSGLLPTTLTFSTDLHSMGQYLQQGRQIFMETMLVVDEPSIQLTIPAGPQEGKTIAELSEAMVKGVIEAHRAEGIPIVEIHMDRLDAAEYGQLLYYLETSCAITAMLSGVNPFDQPGVESYKAEMHKLLD
ncbi:MAG: glucose-6-phosphate isomerase [Bacillota bacterium]|nr:glucose-6-phosphate isomerase [Bacillota bacterium]